MGCCPYKEMIWQMKLRADGGTVSGGCLLEVLAGESWQGDLCAFLPCPVSDKASEGNERNDQNDLALA